MTSVRCGWPAKTYPAEKTVCPCGFIFPDRAPPKWHKDPADDDWLECGDVADEDEMDFG